MNAFELIRLLDTFNSTVLSEAFTPPQKITLAREMIHALPPLPFCAPAAGTYATVKALMTSALENLIAAPQAPVTQEGKEATQAAQEAPAVAPKGRKGTR